jgi:branched-chain amino acid transport system ATP-binding protein
MSSTANLLELKGVHTHIGAYHILHGVDLAVPGPAHHAAGPQRRGQDHHAAHHHGPVAGLQGSIRFNGPGHHRLHTPQIARLASPTCPRTWASSPT